MQCSDLREIADSCLSDDSMIANNQAALEHLEHCDDCLLKSLTAELARHAARGGHAAPSSQISEEFAARLRARLRL